MMAPRTIHMLGSWLGILVCLGCWPLRHGGEKYSQTKEMMGTYVQIDTCLKDAKKVDMEHVYERVWERLSEIAWRMNIYDEKSDVTKINESYPQPVHVESDTYDIIKESLRINLLTQGAFDITVQPLIELWKKAQQDNIAPAPQDVKLLKQAVGNHTINLLDGHQVQLTHPLAKIDLGGIAAGYALDEAARIFRGDGVANFYIDAGGDIIVGGQNCQGRKWRIGIRDPKRKDNLIDTIELSDASVTTSGNYEKYYSVKGQRFSHIINPLTGYPQQGVISATVIAPTGLEADALATALSVMGQDKGTKLIDRLSNGYASLIIIDSQNGPSLFPSQNFNKFRSKPE